MPAPVRVGMLIDSLDTGGAERVAVEVACALDREAFAPFFVSTREGGPLESHLQRARIPYRVIERRGNRPPLRMLARARRALRDADVIHAHMFTSAMWGSVLSRWTGVPLVVRDPTWSGQRTLVRTRGYRHLIGPTARVIVCPSRHVARSIQEEGVPSTKLRVITNGVRLDRPLARAQARAELGLAADDWVIGIIAMLREEKAHEVLLRAVAVMARDGRRPVLCAVGDGPRRAELEQLAGELGIASSVVWAGSRADAGRLASAFDTAVICSNWEGLPLASLEALAAGVPLVATRVGALPEVVAGGAGVLVDVGDAEGLARELAALMDSPERVAELRQKGLERIRSEYRFDVMVERFAALYAELGDRASPR